jgi:hypothetical protein
MYSSEKKLGLLAASVTTKVIFSDKFLTEANFKV